MLCAEIVSNGDRMKTRTKIIISAVCLFIVAALIICVACRPVYYRIYQGDRIKGTLSLTLNDEEIKAKSKNIKCYYNSLSFPEDMLCNNTGDGTKISTRANKTGSYFFVVYADEIKAVPIEIEFVQNLRWNVTNFDLSLNIKQENGSYKVNYNLKYTDISSNCKKVSHNYSKICDSKDDNKISISVELS